MKIVLTGSTGLIGKEAVFALKKTGAEIIYLTRDNCNIFSVESIAEFFKCAKATHLLHLAWNTQGDYINSPLNKMYLEAGINILKYFKEYGGKKAAFAGTCFEYKFKDTPLSEDDELQGTSAYAKAKIRLMQEIMEFSKNNDIETVWGRIFYAYGKNEHESRFTSRLIYNLKNNIKTEIKNPELIRDYIYNKDIAQAFCSALLSEFKGVVNICSGKGISKGEFARKIAKKLNKEELLEFKFEENTMPLIIIGNNDKLVNEVGYSPIYTIDRTIEEFIA